MGKDGEARQKPGKYQQNPIVPVDGGRVHAAIERSGKPQAQVAKEAGVPQQTLSSIVARGDSGRCREATRKSIARVLHVSEAWLAGENQAPVRGLAPWEGHPGNGDPDPPVIVDENAFLLRRDLSGEAAADGAARYQLAWWEIGEMVIRAWRRDLEKGNQGASEALKALPAVGTEEDPGEVFEAVILGVQRILSSTWWKIVLMNIPSEAPEPPAKANGFFTLAQAKRLQAQNEKMWKKRREEADELAVAGAEFIGRILQPWIEGEADLDYEVVVKALRWVGSESLLAAVREPGLGALHED